MWHICAYLAAFLLGGAGVIIGDGFATVGLSVGAGIAGIALTHYIVNLQDAEGDVRISGVAKAIACFFGGIIAGAIGGYASGDMDGANVLQGGLAAVCLGSGAGLAAGLYAGLIACVNVREIVRSIGHFVRGGARKDT
ncbi:hypothetical protein GCM10010191_48580 [Actinomadura vinacea]|uniref:Ammonium transporter AmtB-like domain-containing protein n=1 Tax=Actinomadura vinacea TaxID=115336 RepID=A0ABN3JGT7_9ACTN